MIIVAKLVDIGKQHVVDVNVQHTLEVTQIRGAHRRSWEGIPDMNASNRKESLPDIRLNCRTKKFEPVASGAGLRRQLEDISWGNTGVTV